MKHKFFFSASLCLALLALGSCKKDSDGGDSPSTAAFYFQGKIDGKPFVIEFLPANDIQFGTSNGGLIGPPHCSFDYGAFIGPYDPDKTPSAGVDFFQFFSGDCGDESAVFNTLFPTGSYPFTDEAVGGKGVGVNFTDDDGYFSSARGPQTSAQFSITKSEASNDPFSLAQTISGTAECALYDEFGGKKELTEGLFRLHFRRGL